MYCFFLRVLTDSESVKYAAQSHVLLTSAASTLDETWPVSSNGRNINFLLYLARFKIFWPMSEACDHNKTEEATY